MGKSFGFFIIGALVAAAGFFVWQNRPATEGPAFSKVNYSASRLPAEAANTSEKMRNYILAISSKNDVDTAIDNITKFASENPDDDVAQVYAAMVAPLKLAKGFVYRLRFIVEPVDMLYLGAIQTLRTFKRNADRRGAHIDAIFDYLVDPNPTENVGGQVGPFKSMHAVQDYLTDKFAPLVETKAATLERIARKYDTAAPIFEYDSALLVGLDAAEKMTSQNFRMRKVMGDHLLLAAANVHRNLGMMKYFASYELEQLADFINGLTKETFTARTSQSALNILTRVFKVRIQNPETFRKHLMRHDKLARLRSGKDQQLKDSRTSFIRGAKLRLEAFDGMEQLAKIANQREYLVNAKLFVSRPGFTKAILSKRIRLMESNGPTTFNDRVTNEEFQVNIGAIFNPQNPKIRNLRTLYANSFHNEDSGVKEQEKVSLAGVPGDASYRWNYEYGSAKGWPDQSFAGVLPGTSSNDAYQKKLVSLSRDASTRLLQTWLRLFM